MFIMMSRFIGFMLRALAITLLRLHGAPLRRAGKERSLVVGEEITRVSTRCGVQEPHEAMREVKGV